MRDEGYEPRRTVCRHRRAARADFGTTYIVLLNPAYGSWVSALAKDYMTMSPEARDDFYRTALTE